MALDTGKKILILVPGENARGGITNYYHSIKKDFSYEVDYFYRGSRTFPFKKSFFQPFKDIRRYFLAVRKKEYVLVQTSTSLDPVSIVRDSIFIILAKLYRKKVVIFIRGWHYGFDETFEKKYLWFFKKVFYKADAFIELSEEHKKSWRGWGFKKPVFIETTLVDKNLVKDFREEMITEKFENMNTIEILFLSRIEKAKGIYESIEAFDLLQKKYPACRLSIAGDGRETDKVKEFIAEKNISGITFLDHVSGGKKIACYKNSHIYIFPSYSEGMPNSVLEAMIFGLPIVTRKVGGLVDFFKNGVNGYFTDSKDPKVFYEFMDNLLSNKDTMKKIAITNHRYAKENFLSSNVAKRLEKIFDEVLQN